MKSPEDGIRKAAILVASLEPKAAAMMLRRIDPRQAEKVKSLLARIGPIDPREQRRVIDEFFRIGPMVPEKEPAGLDLDDGPTRNPGRPSQDRHPSTDASSGTHIPPFEFLREAETEKLSRALAAEHPQTVALVLSHLTSAQAGAVLASLPPTAQVEVVRRLVHLEETSPEILREVEVGLQSKLAKEVLVRRPQRAGVEAVSEMLKAAGAQAGMQILGNLADQDHQLAERLGPIRLEFGDLNLLDSASLGTLFESADFELVLLALMGAEPTLVRRAGAALAPAEARLLRERLDNPGPVRLSDVEEARRRLAALARRLLSDGRLAPPRDRPRSTLTVTA